MIVGILGGGQLGRMLALAGYPLGLRFRVLDPNPESPAGHLSELRVAAYDDPTALAAFAEGLAAATYEFENVPDVAAQTLGDRVPVFPPAGALRTAQDRLAEKELFDWLGIPLAPYAPVRSAAELESAIERVGVLAILKTCRLGYDGKGQVAVNTPADAAPAWDALGSVPCVLERRIPLRRELSIIAARGQDGHTAFYPLTQNTHRDGILHTSVAPAPDVDGPLQIAAEQYVGRLLHALEYVGILSLELFVDDRDGRLLANEIAPRVHNSGHWTIEGADTSQFENHLRAVLGLPLGSTAPRGHSAMVNLIGTFPDAAALLAIPGAHLHDYGKAPRPGRKLGHVTVTADTAAERDALLARVLDIVDAPDRP